MDNMYKVILDVLLKYIDEGIHVIDKEKKTIIYNESMEKLEGLRGEEVLGRGLLEVFPSLNDKTSTLCRALEDKTPIIDRYQTYTNKKGYKITTMNSTIPLFIDKEIKGSLEIAKDLTGLKSLYDKISLLEQEVLKSSDNQKKNASRYYTFSDLIGCNLKFLNAISVAKKASRSISTVLIYGETGTGKELFAQSIHSGSDRRDRPFVAQNCAALPEGLLEGILFGTVKGGFTGAVNRPGLFEQANGGTLLLDEINSMDIKLQSKLLRVLQEGYITRIGGTSNIPVDVRIIATTNVEPATAIETGTLRNDLYYRLSVININLPPLRERREDIPLLIRHLINQYNSIMSKNIWYTSEEVEQAMVSYSWPGNVRELKNYIEGAMNMVTSGHVIGKEHFTGGIQATLFSRKKEEYTNFNCDSSKGLEDTMRSIEMKIISETLKKSGGNISMCARILNIKRQTLQHKIKKYNIII